MNKSINTKISTSFSLDPKILNILKTLKIKNYSKLIRYILMKHYKKTIGGYVDESSAWSTRNNNIDSNKIKIVDNKAKVEVIPDDNNNINSYNNTNSSNNTNSNDNINSNDNTNSNNNLGDIFIS